MKTGAAIIRPRPASGFTLVELLVTMAISAVVLSQLVVATYALQRSFESANYRMSAQEDQLRMLDYVSRDLHMATAVTVQNGGAQMTATLPAATTSALNLNLGPLLSPLVASSGTPAASVSTTVTYYAEGGQFVRLAGGVQTVIADTVADLAFKRDGSFLRMDVTFTPEFSNSPTVAAQPATRASSSIYLSNVGTANQTTAPSP